MIDGFDDITDFFDVDEFAISVVITSTSLSIDYTVQGIFDNSYEPSFVGNVGIESSDPSFTVPTDDLQDPKYDDRLSIDGVSYVVTSVQADGTGLTRLILKKAD